MSTGVGNVNYFTAEKPLVDAYWAAHSGVGPGPQSLSNEFYQGFPDSTGTTPGTGWTYDSAYRCWRIATTPGSNSDLVITSLMGFSGVNAETVLVRVGLRDFLSGTLQLLYNAANVQTLSPPVAPSGDGTREFELVLGSAAGAIALRAPTGVAISVAVKSISFTRAPWVAARRIWQAANVGLCT